MIVLAKLIFANPFYASGEPPLGGQKTKLVFEKMQKTKKRFVRCPEKARNYAVFSFSKFFRFFFVFVVKKGREKNQSMV